MGRPKLIKVDCTDGRGLGGPRRKTVSVKTSIPDILDFRDAPGFAYLLLAANPETPVSVLCRVLEAVGPHQVHPEKWMYERRDFFRVPTFPKGIDERAIEVVRAHMGEPSWMIFKRLRGRSIKCSLQSVHRIWMAIRYLSLM